MKRIVLLPLLIATVCISCNPDISTRSSSIGYMGTMNVSDAVCIFGAPSGSLQKENSNRHNMPRKVNTKKYALYKITEQGEIEPVTCYDKYGKLLNLTGQPENIIYIPNSPFVNIVYPDVSLLVNSETEATYIAPIDFENAKTDGHGNIYCVHYMESMGARCVTKVDLSNPDNVTLKILSPSSDKSPSLKAVSADGDVFYTYQPTAGNVMYRIIASNGRLTNLLPPTRGIAFTGLDGKIHLVNNIDDDESGFYGLRWMTVTIQTDGRLSIDTTLQREESPRFVPDAYAYSCTEPTGSEQYYIDDNGVVPGLEVAWMANFKDRIYCIAKSGVIFDYYHFYGLVDSRNPADITGQSFEFARDGFFSGRHDNWLWNVTTTDKYIYSVWSYREDEGAEEIILAIERTNPYTRESRNMITTAGSDRFLSLRSYVIGLNNVIYFTAYSQEEQSWVLGGIDENGEVHILDTGTDYRYINLGYEAIYMSW